MPIGLSPTLANSLLTAIYRAKVDGTDAGTIALPVAAVWVTPHIGDPGAAGTANVSATGDVRKQGTFGTAPSGGSISNTAAISWSDAEVDPATSEIWTHFSAWNASTAGTFLFSGDINPDVTVNATGEGASIAAGALTSSFAVAS